MPTVSEMDGMFKSVYGGEIEKLTPSVDLIARDVPFVPVDQREGKDWTVPVVVSREHGWTLNTDGTAFALNPAISAISKPATVTGAAFCLRSSIAYTAMSKSANRRQAFVDATSYTVENMVETASFVREHQLLYGDGTTGLPAAYDGLGQVESKTGTGGVYACVITAASWAPGLWAGAEGMKVDVYSTAGAKRNAANEAVITAINFTTRAVTITGVDAEITAVAATDVIFFKGAYQNGMAGLFTIANTTGVLFGINNAIYGAWKGQTKDMGASALSFAKVMAAMGPAAGMGLKGVTNLYVSIPTWADLNDNLTALRRFVDKAGGKMDLGAESISYYSFAGVINVKPHIYMKGGYALAFQADKARRLGSTDITFSMPGDGEGRIFFDNPNIAGKEIRNFWHQAIVHLAPNQMVLMTNIVNSADVA